MKSSEFSKICSKPVCQKQDKVSIGTLLLIAILPKCPLCLLSYSTAISLCGGKTIFSDTVGWTSYIPVFLALVLIGTFVLNYKGAKTAIAIALASFACVVILYGEHMAKTQVVYYLGTVMLFMACWTNGSFTFFLNKFINYKTVLK